MMTPEYYEHDMQALRDERDELLRCGRIAIEAGERMIGTLTKERDRLRAALVGLVGVDGREELEQMEAVMRVMPAPAADKAATIDAIHALIAVTCPEHAKGVD